MQAMMIVADKSVTLTITGNGDVLEPQGGVVGTALHAARTLACLASH